MRSDATCIVMKAVILEQLEEEERERTVIMWDGRNFLSGDASHWFSHYGREREREGWRETWQYKQESREWKERRSNESEVVVKNMETVQQRGNKLNDVGEREE